MSESSKRNTEILQKDPISTDFLRPVALMYNPKPIPRPPNPWILFRRDMAALSRKEDPTQTQSILSKKISALWNNASPAVRAEYQAKAARAKADHKIMYPHYRFTPKPRETKKRGRPGRGEPGKNRSRVTAPEQDYATDSDVEELEHSESVQEELEYPESCDDQAVEDIAESFNDDSTSSSLVDAAQFPEAIEVGQDGAEVLNYYSMQSRTQWDWKIEPETWDGCFQHIGSTEAEAETWW
ncbi:hypothetical protein C8J56DRAFT_1063176 [Mycena floridula]|nr:hypothetical protein C8J56DRAFT_1063176 [Mycena floridula]